MVYILISHRRYLHEDTQRSAGAEATNQQFSRMLHSWVIMRTAHNTRTLILLLFVEVVVEGVESCTLLIHPNDSNELK